MALSWLSVKPGYNISAILETWDKTCPAIVIAVLKIKIFSIVNVMGINRMYLTLQH